METAFDPNTVEQLRNETKQQHAYFFNKISQKCMHRSAESTYYTWTINRDDANNLPALSAWGYTAVGAAMYGFYNSRGHFITEW